MLVIAKSWLQAGARVRRLDDITIVDLLFYHPLSTVQIKDLTVRELTITPALLAHRGSWLRVGKKRSY